MTRAPEPFLTATVHGRPATQGSKSAFVVRRRNGTVRAGMREAGSDALKPWREAVRSTVRDVIGRAWEPVEGPVEVVVTFSLPKPASAPKRRRTWPVGARSGDVDKLTRAVFDALTDAGVWVDDSQVVRVDAGKVFVGDGLSSPGAVVSVFRVVDG